MARAHPVRETLAAWAFCGLMLASLFMTGGTWYRIVGWTVIGLFVYFGYGYKHSTLRNGDSSRTAKPGQVSPATK